MLRVNFETVKAAAPKVLKPAKQHAKNSAAVLPAIVAFSAVPAGIMTDKKVKGSCISIDPCGITP